MRSTRTAVGGGPTRGLGPLLVGIPAPLGLGRVELADGSTVVGFLAESYAVAGEEDITGYGSWPAYLSGVTAHAERRSRT